MKIGELEKILIETTQSETKEKKKIELLKGNGGDTVFRGRSPLYPPLPGKVIKLSFSTSPKTLSQGFTSTPVYREAELSASILVPNVGTTQGWSQFGGSLGLIRCSKVFSMPASFGGAEGWRIPLEARSPGTLAWKGQAPVIPHPSSWQLEL